MDFEKLSESRYSCRMLTDKPIPQEYIDKIIKAALEAPTAKNIQNFRIWVIRSQEAGEAVAQATKFTFGAGMFFLVGYKPEDAWIRPADGKNFGDVDAAIVATHMMLEIHELGLGTTWVGYFDAPKLQELLPETAGFQLIAIFPVGYPAPDAAPAPRHFERKAVSELVETL